jgi:autotransporter translocation and assembly factor TamB
MTDSEAHPPQPAEKRKTSRRWPYFLFGPLILLLVAVLALAVFLRTDYGLKRLESLLNYSLDNVRGQSVSLFGLYGRFPFDLRLNTLRLADADGTWLELNDLVLRTSGRDLLSMRLRLHELSAKRLKMQRLPLTEQAEPKPKQPLPGIHLPQHFPNMAVDVLRLDEIVLADAVFGQHTVLSLDANLDAGAHGLKANLRLETASPDAAFPDALQGSAGLLTMQIDFNPAKNLLVLQAVGTDPQGQIAPLLGLPKATPLQLKLDGDGPLSAWEGMLLAQAGDLAALHSKVLLNLRDHPQKLTWSGNVEIDPALLPKPADAYLSRTEFEVEASLFVPDRLYLERVALDNPKMRAQLLADLNLAQAEMMDGELTVDITDTSHLNALLGVELGPVIHLFATASGPLAGPDTHLFLALRDIVAKPARPVRIDRLEMNATIQFPRAEAKDITAQGTLRSTGLHLPDAGLPKALSAALTADFNLSFFERENLLELHALTLHGDGLQVQSRASLALEHMRLDALVDLQPLDLRPWLAVRGLDYRGKFSLKAAVLGTLQPLDLRIDAQAGLEGLGGLPAPLVEIMGKNISMDAAIHLSPPGPNHKTFGLGLIQIDDLRLQAQALTMDAHATFAPQTRKLNASVRLTLPDLSRAAPFPEFDLTGAALLEAKLWGVLDHDLSLLANLTSDNLAVAELAEFPMRLTVQANSLLKAPVGNIAVSTVPLNTPLAASSDFALENDILNFTNLYLKLPEGSVTGQGRINLKDFMTSAEFQGSIENIAPLTRLAGLDLQGKLNFQARLAPDAQALTADLSLELADFKTDFGTFRTLSLQAKARDILVEPVLESTIAIQNIQVGRTQVDGLKVRAKGKLQDLGIFVSAEGRAVHPFAFQAQASYAQKEAAHVVSIQALNGTWADQDLFLSTPLTILTAKEHLSVSPLLLEFGQATVRGQAQIEETQADLKLDVKNLPLALFTENMAGMVTLDAKLSGPKTALAGNIAILAQGISAQAPTTPDPLSMDLLASALLKDDSLTFQAVLHRTADRTPLVQAQGRTGISLSLDPPGLNLPKDSPIQATVNGELDLRWLWEMFFPGPQLLTGILALDLAFSGSLDAPVQSGRMDIRNAAYQHLEQGIFLKEITAAAILDNDILHLSLTATDGGQGSLRGQGQALLSVEQDFPFTFAVQGTGLNILNGPRINARLANIMLELSGTTKAQTARGHLDFDRLEVFLKDVRVPLVTELRVIEISRPDDPLHSQTRIRGAQCASTRASTLSLDVDMRSPAKVFVRGRGLDSEWGGSLHVSGNANQPRLRGDVRPIRGHLDILDIRFTLLPDSIIRFVGIHPPRPYINILAEQTGAEHLFTLVISGMPPDIVFLLKSDPPLPEEEVLSRMLFGRSLASITPVQAARLAMAARDLAGYGADMDILGAAMDILGAFRDILLLDDLDVVSLEAGDLGLRVGKYVHDRVYLRLESNLRTGEEQVSTDVELTPRIGLESRIGDRGGGLGIFWKHDY